MKNFVMRSFLKAQVEFYVRTFAFVTNRIIPKNVMLLGYEIFISNQGPERYHKCVVDIGDYEAINLEFGANDEEIFNVPTIAIKTFHYQRLISFIFSRPQIRRSIIVAQYFNKPIIFPLKSDWIEIFEKNGFQFEKKTSSILWKLLSTTLILRQLVHFISFFFSYRPIRFSNKHSELDRTYKKIFFHDFPPGSLLSEDNDFQYKTSLAWIKQYMQDGAGMVAFSKYGNGSQYGDHIRLSKIYGHIILRKELLIISRLLIYILHNLRNYKNIRFLILNLNEILDFNRVVYYRKNIFVDEVYFNCSMGATKPLWAYAAEKIGIENYLLFYATFTVPRFRDNQVQLSGEWRLATWKNYIVPDLFLKSELQSMIPEINQKFYIFGLAWWVDCREAIHESNQLTVVIFDSPPRKSMYSFSFLSINGFDSNSYQENFLSDILKVYENLNCLILYKAKRPSDDSRYNQFLAKIKSENPLNFRVVSEELAPVRLIKNANIVISRAGSSTALLAKLEGKSSIIYDPTGIVNSKDPSYRSIPIIQKLAALESFVKRT